MLEVVDPDLPFDAATAGLAAPAMAILALPVAGLEMGFPVGAMLILAFGPTLVLEVGLITLGTFVTNIVDVVGRSGSGLIVGREAFDVVIRAVLEDEAGLAVVEGRGARAVDVDADKVGLEDIEDGRRRATVDEARPGFVAVARAGRVGKTALSVF